MLRVVRVHQTGGVEMLEIPEHKRWIAKICIKTNEPTEACAGKRKLCLGKQLWAQQNRTASDLILCASCRFDNHIPRLEKFSFCMPLCDVPTRSA